MDFESLIESTRFHLFCNGDFIPNQTTMELALRTASSNDRNWVTFLDLTWTMMTIVTVNPFSSYPILIQAIPKMNKDGEDNHYFHLPFFSLQSVYTHQILLLLKITCIILITQSLNTIYNN